MSRLYADHNATTPLRPAARTRMLEALDEVGNASSVHAEGRQASRVLEDARQSIAAHLMARPQDVTFTASATEALHLALETIRDLGPVRVLVSPVEHDAVAAFVGRHLPQAQAIPVDPHGRVDLVGLEVLLAQAAPGPSPLVLICQSANNETGAQQDLPALRALADGHGARLLVDAVQSCGKAPLQDWAGLGDWCVVSSHKIGGPLGAAALVTTRQGTLTNARPGGGQERGHRAGTVNVPAIAGFAAAMAQACTPSELARFAACAGGARTAFEAAVCAALPQVQVLGPPQNRLVNTSCLAFPGWEAARQVMALDLAGASVSAGAACSSGKVRTSRVLSAMGCPPELANAAIRASFGWNSTPEDGAALALRYIQACEQMLRRN